MDSDSFAAAEPIWNGGVSVETDTSQSVKESVETDTSQSVKESVETDTSQSVKESVETDTSQSFKESVETKKIESEFKVKRRRSHKCVSSRLTKPTISSELKTTASKSRVNLHPWKITDREIALYENSKNPRPQVKNPRPQVKNPRPQVKNPRPSNHNKCFKPSRHLKDKVWLRCCGDVYIGRCKTCDENIMATNWCCKRIICEKSGGSEREENFTVLCKTCAEKVGKYSISTVFTSFQAKTNLLESE